MHDGRSESNGGKIVVICAHNWRTLDGGKIFGHDPKSFHKYVTTGKGLSWLDKWDLRSNDYLC